MMVIGAHSAHFVWRAGGAVAVRTSAGGAASVIALSYGERGESGELWKEEGQTIERVKEIRKPPALYLFEPHQPELRDFTPNTFVDITPVIEQKLAAMQEMKAQRYLQTYYAQRADQRGNHARRSSGNRRSNGRRHSSA
jgi:LmbE family N-acetylglucosaminyl deacetylase